MEAGVEVEQFIFKEILNVGDCPVFRSMANTLAGIGHVTPKYRIDFLCSLRVVLIYQPQFLGKLSYSAECFEWRKCLERDERPLA